ncbi:hypothetical protein DCW30_07415 [Streptomyces alfalfae]|uniref:Uncharacterized protein n=1 Tax=Streptomyces alfalfae TaxID=1642299 RepID=A0A1P8TLG5_9ACTN|nr:hypothetical protein A7J05_24595 [Streptomyces alfalfae]AYA18849.1 hypothetical protein D3X13_23725 [Streptomyces fradiae]QQC89178.1 hypothetical protein I8755_12710 [Streptomyces alfalfae]QUI31629.1 hypothetical protein H9W91_12750 [Streptomyces alfalfae]RXX46064.1 hypothetical protein DCW30_07415 [Streptomyces alfalfae]
MGDSATEGPFPLPVSEARQSAWIQAVLATEGVNLPRGALENVAPFIVDPEDTLSEADANGVRTLKGSAVRRLRTDAGDMVVAVVRMHGVGGVLWGHNERISSIWRSTADPSVGQGTERTLAPIRPWKGVVGDGSETCLAALESVVPDRQALMMNAEDAANALMRRDRVRPYDLEEDLVLNGQQEPGMYVPQQVRLAETPENDSDGNPMYPSAYWGWMAVRGNNRTQKRQSIYRLSSGEVLSGVPAEKLGRDGDDVVFDPRVWLPQFSALLNREHAEAEDDPDSANGSRARRAAAIAVVDAHLVIGTPTPQRLFRIVQMNNRRDHVHPPLDFDSTNRSRALGRSVLGMYVAQRVMDEKTAEVLSGLAPVRELPDASPGMTVSELRDLRSMKLLQELFPTDPHKRHLLRRALSENQPSQLKAAEIHQRARTWSALTSESYPKPWNPRVGQVFGTKAREGVVLSGRGLRDLLAVADSDDAAFEELVAYRAVHWLASFGIIEADRGSLDGQEAVGDAGESVRRSRRTVVNCLQALRHEKSRMMAAGLLKALVAAMDDGDRRPWQVGPSGKEMPGREMTALWFDTEFPKETGGKPRRAKAATTAVVPPARTVVPSRTALPMPAPGPTPVTSPVTSPETGLRPDPGVQEAAASEGSGPVAPDGADGGIAGPPSPEALVTRLEERIREVHTASGGVEDALAELAALCPGGTAARPLGRERADAAVRLLNQTLSRLRKLPERVEDVAAPA